MIRLAFGAFALLFGGSLSAQKLYSQRGAIDSAYAAEHYPPGSEAGLSEAELREYALLARPGIGANSAAEKRDRMMTLFARMSRAQQLQQRYVFVRPEAPPAPRTLSQQQWKEFSDASRFTILIDGSAVHADELGKYRPADFANWQVDDYEMKPSDEAPFTRKVRLTTHSAYARQQKQYTAHKDRFDQLQIRLGASRGAR